MGSSPTLATNMDNKPVSCKHEPSKVVTRFEDAWMGSMRSGNYEGERTYTLIICRHCGINIRANKELTEWIAVETPGELEWQTNLT